MEQYPDLMSNPQSIVNDEAHKELSDRHLAKLRADTPTSLDQDAKLQVGEFYVAIIPKLERFTIWMDRNESIFTPNSLPLVCVMYAHSVIRWVDLARALIS